MTHDSNPYAIPRSLLVTAITSASLAAVAIVVVAMLTRQAPIPKPTALGNPPGVRDHLLMLDDAAAFADATMTRTRVVGVGGGAPARVLLDDPREKAFPREGSWTSGVIRADFPVTEVVPSWNAQVPADCGVAFEVRARDAASQQWLPWVLIGQWGRAAPGNRTTQFEGGRVDIDTLQLSRPADALQVRATLVSYAMDPGAVPSIRRVAVAYSGVPASAAPPASPARDARAGGAATSPAPIDLAVPFRTQKDAPPALRGQICSPTSVSMVLSYYGIDRDTVDNALAIYDGDNELFGNWNRAVQYAGALGLDAWLARFRSWDAVREELARGHPVIASIRFKKGEFPSNVQSSSNGHLIVIRGIDADGNLIVNDPASREKGNGAVYVAKELGHAWFDHGGVGYVIRGPRAATAATQPATHPIQP